jgi:hypothetical protein
MLFKTSATFLVTMIAGFSSVSSAQVFYCNNGSELNIFLDSNEITLAKNGVKDKGVIIGNEVKWDNSPKQAGLPKRIAAIALIHSPKPGVVFENGIVCDRTTNPVEYGGK